MITWKRNVDKTEIETMKQITSLHCIRIYSQKTVEEKLLKGVKRVRREFEFSIKHELVPRFVVDLQMNCQLGETLHRQYEEVPCFGNTHHQKCPCVNTAAIRTHYHLRNVRTAAPSPVASAPHPVACSSAPWRSASLARRSRDDDDGDGAGGGTVRGFGSPRCTAGNIKATLEELVSRGTDCPRMKSSRRRNRTRCWTSRSQGDHRRPDSRRQRNPTRTACSPRNPMLLCISALEAHCLRIPSSHVPIGVG